MTTYAIILTVMIVWQAFGTLQQATTWEGSPFAAVIAFSLNTLFLVGLLYLGGVL